jgi:hypothetical protein
MNTRTVRQTYCVTSQEIQDTQIGDTRTLRRADSAPIRGGPPLEAALFQRFSDCRH